MLRKLISLAGLVALAIAMRAQGPFAVTVPPSSASLSGYVRGESNNPVQAPSPSPPMASANPNSPPPMVPSASPILCGNDPFMDIPVVRSGRPLPPPDTQEGPCTFSYSPQNGGYPYSDAVWIKRFNSGYNDPYICFSQFVNQDNQSQGLGVIKPQNNSNPPFDYVQQVCSTSP